MTTTEYLPVVTGNPIAISYEDVVHLIFALPPAVRQEAVLKAHPKIVKLLGKLKDSAGRELYCKSGTFFGYPLTVDESLSDNTLPGNTTLVLANDYYSHSVSLVQKEVTHG